MIGALFNPFWSFRRWKCPMRENLRAIEIAVYFSTVSFRNVYLLKLKEGILAQIMISIKHLQSQIKIRLRLHFFKGNNISLWTSELVLGIFSSFWLQLFTFFPYKHSFLFTSICFQIYLFFIVCFVFYVKPFPVQASFPWWFKHIFHCVKAGSSLSHPQWYTKGKSEGFSILSYNTLTHGLDETVTNHSCPCSTFVPAAASVTPIT